MFQLSVTYVHGDLILESRAANYTETVPAIVGLVPAAGGSEEQIHSVGVAPDQIKGAASRGNEEDRSCRFVDPFAIRTFDPRIAANAIRYLAYLARGRVSPAWRPSVWRSIFRASDFDVPVSISN